jgi:uncharacterized protein
MNKVEADPYEVVKSGKEILEWKSAKINSIVSRVGFTELSGYRVPCCNAAMWKSEIAHRLTDDYPFSIVWSMDSRGKVAWSLRSRRNGGIDVSLVAKKYGGGGHFHAASFLSDAPPEMI